MTKIQLDTHAEHANSNGTTLSITIGNNSNRLLVVSVQMGRAKAAGYGISGITFGSQNLTKLDSTSGAGSSFENYQEVWYLIAPTVGAGTITITTTGSPTFFGLTATSWYNVNQVNGISSVTKSKTSGSVPATYSLAITPTTTGSAIVCCLTSETGSVTSPNKTNISLGADNGENCDAATQWDQSPIISSVNTFTWSDSAGANTTVGYTMIAFEILVFSQSISDTLSIVESITKLIAKSISDSISLSGEKVNKSINKTISDTLSISDSVHVNKVAQSISDNILTTDTVSISKTIIRSVVDNLSAGDVISKSLGKKINDSPSLSDVLSKNINKILSDNLSLVDIISKSITKLIVENPSFLDSTGQSKTLVRQITDALSLLESVVVAKQITTKIIDNLSSGDSISKNIGKLLQDNPVLAEQLSKAIGKIITDNISIPDSVTKNIGSLLLNQTRRINLNNTTQQTIAEGKPRNVTI